MFSGERTRKIKELLLEYHEVDVNTLCNVLSASLSTVRRDLDKLEMEGFLKRTHGGAILVEQKNTASSALPIEVNDDVLNIASLAQQMIEPGDQIFLGGGSICRQIAAYLAQGWKGSVITNNIDVVYELSGCPDIISVILGGQIQDKNGHLITDSMTGVTEIENIVVNKAFISVTGFNENFGYFVDSNAQAELYKILKQNSMDVFVVATRDQYKQIGLVRLGSVEQFPKIITNVNIADDFKQYCYKNEITMYTSFNS